MKESEDRMKMTMSKNEQTMKNEKDAKIKAAKDEIIQLQEQCKNSEVQRWNPKPARRMDEKKQRGRTWTLPTYKYPIRHIVKLSLDAVYSIGQEPGKLKMRLSRV